MTAFSKQNVTLYKKYMNKEEMPIVSAYVAGQYAINNGGTHEKWVVSELRSGMRLCRFRTLNEGKALVSELVELGPLLETATLGKPGNHADDVKAIGAIVKTHRNRF